MVEAMLSFWPVYTFSKMNVPHLDRNAQEFQSDRKSRENRLLSRSPKKPYHAKKQTFRDDRLLSLLEEESSTLLYLRGPLLIAGLERATKLLFELEPAPSALMRAIDEKGQDFSTYFLAAFSDTGDLAKSLSIFRTVRSLVRYIVLMDRYYEVGDLKYRKMASEMLKVVRKDSKGHLGYSIPYSLKSFWPFWDFESLMKKRMLAGMTFSTSEIRNHNMFKSSDAPAIYANVLDSELLTFDRNVSLVLHYNQALQDIKDDFDDIEEDLYDKMPNIFLLGTVEHTSFSELASHPDKIRETIASAGVKERIVEMADVLEKSALGVQLPPAYGFLKELTIKYAQDVRGILRDKIGSAQHDDNIDTKISKVLLS
jgi:hypothetical protein